MVGDTKTDPSRLSSTSLVKLLHASEPQFPHLYKGMRLNKIGVILSVVCGITSGMVRNENSQK